MYAKPILVYDGECPFCRLWVGQWQRHSADRIIYAPFQEVHTSFPEIPRKEFARSVYLILPDGTAYQGAEAVFQLLARSSRLGRASLWLYHHVPGFGRIAEWCYSFVAARRPFFFRLTRLIFGKRVTPVRDPTHGSGPSAPR
jgi:predicted DCC family thiol-disulfide oxidoreductase YuxK